MHIEKIGNQLTIKLLRDFNLLTARKIDRLSRDVSNITIDLANSRFVDSEALKVLYRLVTSGKVIKLKNPPELFSEIIQVLGLHPVFDVKKMVEDSG